MHPWVCTTDRAPCATCLRRSVWSIARGRGPGIIKPNQHPLQAQALGGEGGEMGVGAFCAPILRGQTNFPGATSAQVSCPLVFTVSCWCVVCVGFGLWACLPGPKRALWTHNLPLIEEARRRRTSLACHVVRGRATRLLVQACICCWTLRPLGPPHGCPCSVQTMVHYKVVVVGGGGEGWAVIVGPGLGESRAGCPWGLEWCC